MTELYWGGKSLDPCVEVAPGCTHVLCVIPDFWFLTGLSPSSDSCAVSLIPLYSFSTFQCDLVDVLATKLLVNNLPGNQICLISILGSKILKENICSLTRKKTNK